MARKTNWAAIVGSLRAENAELTEKFVVTARKTEELEVKLWAYARELREARNNWRRASRERGELIRHVCREPGDDS
jgi:hypothetical protein